MKKFQITFKGQRYELEVEELTAAAGSSHSRAAQPAVVTPTTPLQQPAAPKQPAAPGSKTVLAPMPGKIMAVNIKAGDNVKRGDVIFILEAMKMQNEIMATQDGMIASVAATVGQSVSTGETLAAFA